MARTPEPPKLKPSGLSALQRTVLFFGIIYLIYSLIDAENAFWTLIRVGFGVAFFFALATPSWRKIIFSPEAWFKPSEWVKKEPFAFFSRYRNRANISLEDNLALQNVVQNILHLAVILPIMAVGIYFFFIPVMAFFKSLGVTEPYFVFCAMGVWFAVFLALGGATVARLFHQPAWNIVFTKDGYDWHGGDDQDDIASPQQMTRDEKIRRIMEADSPDNISQSPVADDFAFNPAVFENGAATPAGEVSVGRKIDMYKLRYLYSANKKTRDNAREQILALGGEVPEKKEGDPAAFEPSALDELTYIADYAPENLTPEQRHTVYDYAKKVEWDLPKLFAMMEAKADADNATSEKAGKIHPDDAALWEVVNDAGSTAEERKTALDLILERETGRLQDRE